MLATNALVEGAVRPAGLVAIGFEPETLARVDAGVGVPIVAIGAPAPTYAPLVAALLGTNSPARSAHGSQ